jgi:hypothetical protein
MKTLCTIRDDLDHEIRNAILGMALEARSIVKAMHRLQTHINRIDVACSTCLAQMEKHSEFSIVEKREDKK